jgi:4-oxalocrotonate tautomerase
MPAVTIQQGPRDVGQKRELIKKITDAFVETYRIPAETVMVFVEETPTDSFGVGGKLAAD